MILTAGARRRHVLPGRRSCAGSADMPHPGAHASGVPLVLASKDKNDFYNFKDRPGTGGLPLRDVIVKP